MKRRRGISPVLATVIIIAVTLVIAIGLIGWIMGIWGSFGGTEQLMIMPDSKITNTSVILHISNKGTLAAVITKVEVVGIGTWTGEEVVSAGSDVTLTFTPTFTATPVPGSHYTVKVYTASGNVYTAIVQCV